MNLVHVFSTNCMCFRASSTVQALEITCVLLPYLMSGFSTVEDCRWNQFFSGWVMWSGICASWAHAWAELGTCVCTHGFSRVLALLLWWMLFANPFHLGQNNSWCLWLFFFWSRLYTNCGGTSRLQFQKHCLNLVLMKVWCSSLESARNVSGFQQH